MLFPEYFMPRQGVYFNAHDTVSYVIREMGYTIDYATETRIADGRLDKYKILVMPAADYISDATYAKVMDFVNRGGTVVVLQSFPLHDWEGKSRDVSFFESGKKDAVPFDAGGNTILKYKAGKGQIYYMNIPPSKEKGITKEAKDSVSQLLEKVIADNLSVQPVKIRSAFCENRTIFWKEKDRNMQYLTFVTNENGGENLVLKPEYLLKVKSCVDLITGEEMKPDQIKVLPWTARLLLYEMEKN